MKILIIALVASALAVTACNSQNVRFRKATSEMYRWQYREMYREQAALIDQLRFDGAEELVSLTQDKTLSSYKRRLYTWELFKHFGHRITTIAQLADWFPDATWIRAQDIFLVKDSTVFPVSQDLDTSTFCLNLYPTEFQFGLCVFVEVDGTISTATFKRALEKLDHGKEQQRPVKKIEVRDYFFVE